MEEADYASVWKQKETELGNEPLPLEPNISREYFERERERLFKRVWLNVGREEDVAKVGDYFVKDLPVLETSLLVTRGADGKVRAFHNMCRHRGNKVVKSCAGTAKGFQCGFHGWTYDLEGKLVHVPDEGQFPPFFEKEDHGLAPVATETLEGFVFINVDPQPRQTLRQFLAGLWNRFEGYPFGTMPRVARWTAEVNANWKVAEDAFLEGYHVAFVHKRSLPDVLTGDENPFCHHPPPHFFGPHKSVVAVGNMKHQPKPAEAIAYKGGVSLVSALAAGADSVPRGVNPDRRPDWAFDHHFFFPNLWLYVFRNMYFTYNFWPLSVDRTLYEVNYYALPAAVASGRVSQEYFRVLLRDSLREDLSTLESTHETQRSGAMTHMTLSTMELMVRQHRKSIDEFVNAA